MRQSVLGIALAALLFAPGYLAEAQQPTKIPRIGYLAGGDATSARPPVEAFQQGLRELGYVEGKNILVEYRYAEGRQDHVPRIVSELVQLKVDLLVVIFSIGTQAAKEATKTIPIVMVAAVDPVATGLVDSLGTAGWESHGPRHIAAGPEREKAGVAEGGRCRNIACRDPLGCRRARVEYRL
jgi:putative ABC transport system substrate-binding protein